MNWYYKLLAQRPHLILIAVLVFSIACIVISLTIKKVPNFSDPTLGFEARGTKIGQKLTAWKNLLEETRPSGNLIPNPYDLIPPQPLPSFTDDENAKRNKFKKKHKNKTNTNKLNKKIKYIKELALFNQTFNYNWTSFDDSDDNDTFNNRHSHWGYGKNLTYENDEEKISMNKKTKEQWKILSRMYPPTVTTVQTSDGLFCESPNKEYAHFVVQRVDMNLNESLYELNSLLAMCDLEEKITNVDGYEELCQKELNSEKCCKPWSLPNYIALLANKTSCFQIEEEDLLNVKNLLLECFQYYHNFKLGNDCEESKCRVPSECAQNNAVYNILHFLSDLEFLKLNDSTIYLNAAMIFLPIARSTKALPFYHNIAKETLTNDQVTIVAIDMGIKNALFDECLLSDGWLVGLGGLFIFLCMWIYTASIFVTIMTVIAVVFSLGISYFVYSIMFKVTFFPFMNLLAVIVVVGIGADDAFIFVKIWNCVISERIKNTSGVQLTSSSSFSSDLSRSDTLSGLIGCTLKHAALSMLVTSVTTAAAFYSSYVSSITADRCFGIFAGTTVIINYFLMITWLPASISIAERLTCFSSSGFLKNITDKITFPIKKFCQLSQRIEDAIVLNVIRFAKLWIVIFTIIGIVSGVLVLYWPRLRLPDSPDFKLFVSDHPFEMYDSIFRDMFWFEKIYTSSDSFKLPLRFVWGIEPIDNGNYLDPSNRGKLIFDNNFNISSTESQIWLLKFCKKLKTQKFYQRSFGILLPNCFIENFIEFMKRRCFDVMDKIDRTPCCEISKFPFEPHIFDECLLESISSLYQTPREFFIPGIAGPKFSHPNLNENLTNFVEQPIVKALIVEYDSTQTFTMSYTELDNFVFMVQSWLDEMLKTAPDGMKNGWFTSELDFYDLQETLSTGTITAIFMSMSVALVILLLVTLNVLISLYAIITVTFTIFTTVAILVLLDWKLNILESIAVSTTIGLAVDFSLHYGVHYRLSSEPDRKSATKFSLQRMLAPTTMAAVTTGAAGAFMIPSNVLAYIQIGIFLVVVMSVSWFYATFFLMSLLSVAGPQYGFGQFSYPKFGGNSRGDNTNGKGKGQIDSSNRSTDNHGTVSEQLLSGSSSAVGELVGSESHELDALTSNSVIKSALECSRPINFDRAFIKNYSSYPSPSTISSITVVLPD